MRNNALYIAGKRGSLGGINFSMGHCTIEPVSQQTAGYVATIRDISEQKKREDLFASEYRQLADVASQDELTGIANCRTFNQTLRKEALRQNRPTLDLSLLLLDVDHFTQYNDLYGHLPGDTCLKRIAETVRETLPRDADLVARFGGEEFVVLMPMTDTAGAQTVARHILQAVSDLAIPHAGSPHGIVTVSIGIACWPSGLPLNQTLLLEQADRALYQAKDLGRNTYHVIDWKGLLPG